MKRRGRWITSILILATMLAGGGLVLNGPKSAQAASKPAAETSVPVTVTQAQLRDVPVYLDGIGTVQAFKTVEVKAQVNGVLTALPAREGQEVQKGQIVAEIDPAPYKAALDQAIAQRSEDEAQLQSAQLDLARYARLAKSSYAPAQQVDDERATVGKFQAAIQADSAMIETAQINVGYCTIRAPFTGRVSFYQIDVGNLIAADGSAAILTITEDKPIAVVFTLPEDELLDVQEAMAHGPLPVQVTDKDSGAQITTGVLMTPNNAIDTATGTISLKARFANADDHLWPGQFVNARLQVRTLHNAVTVPSIAVQHGPDGLYVFVVKSDQTVAQVPVGIGYEDGGTSVVTEGLSGHETIVTSGQYRLTPGVKVEAQPAADAGRAAAAEAAKGGGSAG